MGVGRQSIRNLIRDAYLKRGWEAQIFIKTLTKEYM